VDINLAAVQAEVSAAFWRYVEAINANDMDVVTELFWDSEHTLRYGARENLYGKRAIADFRNSQRGKGLTITVRKLVITTFGADCATANCEMSRSDSDEGGRMSHTWVRLPSGWRIVAAHVSANPER
jgi:ketosteroid isomerase-like protein